MIEPPCPWEISIEEEFINRIELNKEYTTIKEILTNIKNGKKSYIDDCYKSIARLRLNFILKNLQRLDVIKNLKWVDMDKKPLIPLLNEIELSNNADEYLNDPRKLNKALYKE